MSKSIKAYDVVVGDIILIEPGMRVPADCIVFEGQDISVDESLYHEDRETVVPKQISTGVNHRENPDPFLMQRTLVLSGYGRAVVCCVGENCQIASRLNNETLEDDEENLTPL